MQRNFQQINKFTLIFFICILNVNVFSQIINVEKVISGDYKSIKENKIKTIILKAGNSVVNEILVNLEKNEVIIYNKDSSIHYYLNDVGNPKNIIVGNSFYALNYFDNNYLREITKTSLDDYSIKTTYYSDQNNLKTIHNKSLDF